MVFARLLLFPFSHLMGFLATLSLQPSDQEFFFFFFFFFFLNLASMFDSASFNLCSEVHSGRNLLLYLIVKVPSL